MGTIKQWVIGSVFTIMCMAGFLAIGTNVNAMTNSDVYLEVGESYKVTLTTKKPVLDALGTEDKKIATASISKSTLTIKGVKKGYMSFYINKNGSTANSNRVRKVRVHIYPTSSSITTSLTNNISHANGNNSNYTNQPVYVYGGRSFVITASATDLPTSIASTEWSGKAKGLAASSIYECLDTNGNGIQAGGTWYFAPNTLSGLKRTFTARSVTGGINSYIRGTTVWYSSAGKAHYTKMRVINTKIYPLPVVNVYNKNGTEINSLSLFMGNSVNVTTTLKNMQNGDVVYDRDCVIQDESKISVDDNGGSWEVTPLGLTNGIAVKATFKYSIENAISVRNGENYTTFSKVISINVAKLNAVTIEKGAVGKKSIKITWTKNNNAARYLVFRADSENGDYEEIGSTGECYYTDTEDLQYNKTYYYKVKALGSDEDTESDFSKAYGVKLTLLKPYISSVEKIGETYLVTINGVKYDGFEIYSGNNKTLISSTRSNSVNIVISGNGELYVRAFVGSGKSRIYSAYSNGYKIQGNNKNNDGNVIINSPTGNLLKKPKIKKLKAGRNYVSVVIKKKAAKYNGSKFQIKFSTKSNFKNAKIKKCGQKTRIKGLRKNKRYFFKVRVLKVVNGQKKYSKWSGVKSVKTKK